jgi:hypothetical protein
MVYFHLCASSMDKRRVVIEKWQEVEQPGGIPFRGFYLK